MTFPIFKAIKFVDVKFCLLSAGFIFSFSLQAQDTSFKAYSQTIPGSNIQFKMVPIPGGTFSMGSPDSDKNAEKDELPQRSFSISPFWMGAYEVTHDEFDLFSRTASSVKIQEWML